MSEPCGCYFDLYGVDKRIQWCDLHARAEQTAAERDRYKRERDALMVLLEKVARWLIETNDIKPEDAGAWAAEIQTQIDVMTACEKGDRS